MIAGLGFHNVRRVFKQQARFAGGAQGIAVPSWRPIIQVAQEQEEGSDGQRGDQAGCSEPRLLHAQIEAVEEEIVSKVDPETMNL